VQFDVAKILLLTGNDATVKQSQEGVPPAQIVASWSMDLAAFEKTRRKYFLYK
jgi:uncharacterized protein YbbC (DUF1343 family)